MGLDIFDVMGAVGQGGQVYAEVKREDKKAALAERLEKEREARANDYQIARESRAEKRDLAEVATTEFQEGEEGVLWKITKNKRGEPLEKVLASADERATRDYERQKMAGGIDLLNAQIMNTEATAQLNAGKAAHADEYQSLQDEVLRARADASRAQAERNRRPPPPKKADTSLEDRSILAGAEQRIQAAGDTPEARRKMAKLLAKNPATLHLASKIDPNWNKPERDD